MQRKVLLRRTPQASSDIPQRARSMDRANLFYRIWKKKPRNSPRDLRRFYFNNLFSRRNTNSTYLLRERFESDLSNTRIRLDSDGASREIISAFSLQLYVIQNPSPIANL